MCANTDCAVVLLLLLCVEIGLNKPIDFICDPQLRRSMDVTPSLDTLRSQCVDQLPSPVLCPCVRIHRASWTHTPFQQRQAFVRDSLGALLRSLRSVREGSSSSCQILILQKLEHSVRNHLLIVSALERQMSTFSPEPSCKGHQASNLTETVKFYGRLVRGPVELLLESLQHVCQNTHDT